jgi:hypothetical protein
MRLTDHNWEVFIIRLVVSVIMSMVVLASWPVVALAADGEKLGNGDERPVTSSTLYLEQISWSGIDGSDVSIKYTEFSTELKWQFLLFEIDHREYKWRDSASMEIDSGLDPWGTLTRIVPGLQYYREFFEKWGVWVKLKAIAGFDDAISSQSWTYNPQVLGFYMPTHRTTLFGGLGMLYHPVDSFVYPVLGVAWNMESRDGLSGALGFPETMLRYGFNESVALKIDFQWDIRTYCLVQDDTSASGGFVKTKDLEPGLQLEYEPIKGLTLSPGIRWYLGRSLTVFDHEKMELTSNNVSASSAFLFEIDYQF